MKKLMHILFLSASLLSGMELHSAMPGQGSSSKITPPTFQPPPGQQQKPEPQKPMRPYIPPRPMPAPPVVPFTIPGIVGFKNGALIGSDNLYNLSPDINVYVEIVMPEGKKFTITEQEVKARLIQILTRVGINPVAIVVPGEAPLPLFHVLIMLNQEQDCYLAFCSCRLFESVTLKRVILNPGITFQAITWEKQELITAAKKDFYPLLNKTLADFTEQFVERYQYFINLRMQTERNR